MKNLNKKIEEVMLNTELQCSCGKLFVHEEVSVSAIPFDYITCPNNKCEHHGKTFSLSSILLTIMEKGKHNLKFKVL